jgi:hypothetical protein
MIDDDQIRNVIGRLARPHRSGGDVIERAAILASGADAEAIVEWIIVHGGAPEAQIAAPRAGGLHGGRRDGGRHVAPPSRYLLPAGTLSAG